MEYLLILYNYQSYFYTFDYHLQQLYISIDITVLVLGISHDNHNCCETLALTLKLRGVGGPKINETIFFMLLHIDDYNVMVWNFIVLGNPLEGLKLHCSSKSIWRKFKTPLINIYIFLLCWFSHVKETYFNSLKPLGNTFNWFLANYCLDIFAKHYPH